MNLKNWVRDIADFPIPGILFRDISPLLQNPQALEFAAAQMVAQTDLRQIDFFVGIESRGFILAAYMAAKYSKGFIPLRKAGKLPPPLISQTYTLEYGTATLEINPGQGRVFIVDDVLATGGTLKTAIDLCTQAGFQVKQVAVLINLIKLNQLKFDNQAIHSALQY